MKPSLHSLAFLFLLAVGFAVRQLDLTDLPLDFHPTRQLVSAIKARGMYYQGLSSVPEWQRQFAVRQWHSKAEIEPEIIERLAAFTYHFTGERLWLGRLYSSLFWLAGAIFLYKLSLRLSSHAGALAAMAIYLLLPYAVIASRSFQPDPLMVLGILAFWWALDNWGQTAEEQHSSELRWAIVAGFLGGFAILVKFSSAFFIAGGGLGIIIGRRLFPAVLRRRSLWSMVLLGVLPGLLYLIYGVFIAGFLGKQFGDRFIPALLISPSYYLNWISTLTSVFGLLLIPLSLLGSLLFHVKSARVFLLSLWVAYLAYGFYFDYHIWSHDYYNLPLIPIVALSIAPLVDHLAAGLDKIVNDSRPAAYLVTGALLFGILTAFFYTRAELKSVDYRPEAEMWEQIGRELGPDARLVALTQDYGSRLAYWGWIDPVAWPLAGDIAYHTDLRGAQNDFDNRFEQLSRKRDFFLVTLPAELTLQPMLAERLAQYPIYLQGDGYVVYDLR